MGPSTHHLQWLVVADTDDGIYFGFLHIKPGDLISLLDATMIKKKTTLLIFKKLKQMVRCVVLRDTEGRKTAHMPRTETAMVPWTGPTRGSRVCCPSGQSTEVLSDTAPLSLPLPQAKCKKKKKISRGDRHSCFPATGGESRPSMPSPAGCSPSDDAGKMA